MSSLLPFLTPNANFTPSGVFLHLSQPTHTHTHTSTTYPNLYVLHMASVREGRKKHVYVANYP